MLTFRNPFGEVVTGVDYFPGTKSATIYINDESYVSHLITIGLCNRFSCTVADSHMVFVDEVGTIDGLLYFLANLDCKGTKALNRHELLEAQKMLRR